VLHASLLILEPRVYLSTGGREASPSKGVQNLIKSSNLNYYLNVVIQADIVVVWHTELSELALHESFTDLIEFEETCQPCWVIANTPRDRAKIELGESSELDDFVTYRISPLPNFMTVETLSPSRETQPLSLIDWHISATVSPSMRGIVSKKGSGACMFPCIVK
jgi:hypothetical protein